jgi:S1-C subfamily serine protease
MIIRILTGAVLLISAVAGGVPAQSGAARKDVPAIAKAANGSIVSIVMSDQAGKPIAQGSGFVASKDGLVVTNYHVIAEGSSAVVKLPDGAFYAVDGLLASDKTRDIAVIKAHGQNFRTLILGNSDRVQIGEEVVAIGNPLSLESTVSNGIVSGIRTVKEEGGKYLQITAPISPGSSGGPLFNMAGEVVGITTMHLRGGENLNFAIPINDAKHLLVADSTKLKELPNEEVTSELESNEAGSGILCSYFVGRITNSLPQVPTLCENDTTAGKRSISIFSPNPVLGGALRRAWSTALFQTMQAAAIDGPCQRGCLVSVADSRMASAALRYETYISKEDQMATKEQAKLLGGFGSDDSYFFEWSELLEGTRSAHPLNENRAKYLVNDACKDYLQLLRENPGLSSELKHSSETFPGLPTCSAMMTTDSRLYILVDFPNSVMPMFSFFTDPLVDAFHSLGRYDGQIVFRGPWFTYKDGSKGRYYGQYSLHWLAFFYDETSSGARSAASLLFPLKSWALQSGQVYPASLFAENEKAGKFIARDAAVYKIVRFQGHSRIQLTDGSEWMVNADASSKCGLLLGDKVSISAQKSAEGGGEGTRLAKGPCSLEGSFVGAWPTSNGPN